MPTQAYPLPEIAVIIPVYNGAATLGRCLSALYQTAYPRWHVLVVDDGSSDSSAQIARRQGAQLLATPHAGPAQARNLAAQATQADILLFIDADVLVHSDTLAQVAAIMQPPEVAACFGSYDATPAEANFLSQYRNLLHHYTHQTANPEATTFWSGCGAIRRELFLALDGFETAVYPRPSIEDIALGYRLRAAGHRIRLDKTLQVTHLKRWTAGSLLLTDIRDRAIPWANLILTSGHLPNDLNLQINQRWSATAVYLLLFSASLGFLWPVVWRLTAVAAFLLLWLNRGFYRFLQRQRGWWFLLRALPWHWLYFAYSAAAFGGCWVRKRVYRYRGILVQYTNIRIG